MFVLIQSEDRNGAGGTFGSPPPKYLPTQGQGKLTKQLPVLSKELGNRDPLLSFDHPYEHFR